MGIRLSSGSRQAPGPCLAQSFCRLRLCRQRARQRSRASRYSPTNSQAAHMLMIWSMRSVSRLRSSITLTLVASTQRLLLVASVGGHGSETAPMQSTCHDDHGTSGTRARAAMAADRRTSAPGVSAACCSSWTSDPTRTRTTPVPSSAGR